MKKVLIFIVTVALAAALYLRGQSNEKAVDVVHPARGPAVEGVYATGTVEPSVMLPIASRNSGRLMALNADEGQAVVKDQVLGHLEDSDLQKNLEGLRAKENFAAGEYARQSGLLKKGFATRQAVDQAKAELDSATAAAAAITAQIGYSELRAPADGKIIRRDGEVGELITANKPVFWLSCCSPLRIGAEVDEEDIPYVRPGMKVLIRADAFPGKVFNGAVQSITPKGDATARSFRVRISLSGETPLLIGMTVETNIVTEEKADALLVPTQALQGDAVLLVRDGRIVAQPVTVGVKGIDKAAITGDVTEADLVVKAPGEDMKPGDSVRTKLVP